MKKNHLEKIEEALEIPEINPEVRVRVWGRVFEEVSPPPDMRNDDNWHEQLALLEKVIKASATEDDMTSLILSSEQSYTARTRIHLHVNGKMSEAEPDTFECPDPSVPARALDIYIYSLAYMIGFIGSLVHLTYASNPPREIVEKLMEISKVISRDDEKQSVLNGWHKNTIVWLRGVVNHFDTLERQKADKDLTDDRVLKSFFDNPKVRKKLAFVAHQVPLLTEVGVVAELTRIGFQTLGTTFPAMSDMKWFTAVQNALKKKQEKGNYKDDDEMEKDKMLEDRVNQYFEANGPTENPMPTQIIREKIPVDLLKAQLTEAMERCDHQTINTMIRVIAEFVLKEISPYEFSEFRPERNSYATVGTPKGALRTTQVSCFMSTWVTASLLMECGIPEERILFTRVTRAFSDQIGEHGALMILGNRSIIYVNPAFNNVVTLKEYDETDPLLPFFSWAEILRLEMVSRRSLRHLPIARRIEFPRNESPDKMAQSMEVYPLNLGITGQFMSHLGLIFMQEGDLEAADFAHRLSIAATPISTYSWYNWGMSAYIQDDLTNAKKRWENALELFEENHTARMGLACIELIHKKRPNKRKVKQLLNPVVKEKGSIWQIGRQIKSIAREVLDMVDSGRIDEARVELGKVMHYI